MIQLYSYFRSSASYRVRVALAVKGLSYEYKPIHLINGGGEQNQAEFKVLNPMGQVPCLVHNELILSQSMAIIQYLDETYPQPALFPKASAERAMVMQLCEMVNSGVHPIQNLAVMSEIGQRYNIEKEGRIEWASYWIERGFKAIERVVEQTAGELSFGDQLTAADLFIVPQMYNAHRFQVEMEQFPTLLKIEKNCLAMEVFKKSEPGSQEDTP